MGGIEEIKQTLLNEVINIRKSSINDIVKNIDELEKIINNLLTDDKIL